MRISPTESLKFLPFYNSDEGKFCIAVHPSMQSLGNMNTLELNVVWVLLSLFAYSERWSAFEGPYDYVGKRTFHV
jgi:hypothetical protein